MGEDNLHCDKPHAEAVRLGGLARGLLKTKTTKTR